MLLNKEKIIMYGLPIWLFLLFLIFYNYGNISPRELNKTAGLLALTLVGITLLIGPLSKFWPDRFNRFKVYRKYLGISGVLFVVAHALLSLIFYYNLDLAYVISENNPNLWGVYAAAVASLIFLLMTITSNEKAVLILGYNNWKLLQSCGYIALALVMVHFFTLEREDGVFRIKRLLGQLAFTFGIIVLAARLIVFLMALEHRKSYEEHFR